MKKKLFAGFIGTALVAMVALAGGLNTYDGNTYQTLLVPTSVSANTTGSVVNVGPYQGIASVVLAVGDNIADVGTNTITLQHATTSGGTYSTVTNEAGTAVTKSVVTSAAGTVTAYKLDLSTAHGFMRAVATPAGTTGTVSAIIVLPPR